METFLIVFTLSLDAFVASIAYGTNRIEMPFKSMVIIDIVCTSLLAISVFLGTLVRNILPQNYTSIISFLILMLLGIYYLLEGVIKTYIKKVFILDKEFKFKLFDIWFVITVYMDEIKADFDNSKILSLKEALYLGIALSLDSLAIGFGSSLRNINCIGVISLSLIANMVAIWGGLAIGKRFIERTKVNLSWLAGIILIILAFLKLK
ncbi:MAG TPA: sporulation membrane protein YtaF [Tepidimicrobium sp.]|nr:sporulation membrane protein YtaF [Tepidimicrobium sp.]